MSYHRTTFFAALREEFAQDRVFYVSLLASVLAHGIVLSGLFLKHLRTAEKIHKVAELVYHSASSTQRLPPEPMVKKTNIKEQKLTPPPEILDPKTPRKETGLEGAKKDPFQWKKNQKIPPKLLGQKRQVAVPLLKSEKINNPKYLNYHDLIRNKIKKRAYQYVEDPRFQEGEVYLTFVLSADGQLKDLKVKDEQTSANDYLRSVGLRSIKESNPFPPFPSDLSYPELSFNVVISFEVDE